MLKKYLKNSDDYHIEVNLSKPDTLIMAKKLRFSNEPKNTETEMKKMGEELLRTFKD